MKQVTVVTLVHEGLISQVGLVARVRYAGVEDDLEARIRSASRTFAISSEGKAFLETHHGRFSVGDALTKIPATILGFWGILEIEILEDNIVILDHDRKMYRKALLRWRYDDEVG